MKIAISGSGNGTNPEILNKSKELGKLIAKNNHILLYGGCKGYPYSVARGALLENGKVIAYSPAKDEQEHIERYSFSIDHGIEYVYTKLGIPERNIPLIKNADIVIILDGQIGTLNEFCIAFHENKEIRILKLGDLPEILPKITKICNKKSRQPNIIYSDDPKHLIK